MPDHDFSIQGIQDLPSRSLDRPDAVGVSLPALSRRSALASLAAGALAACAPGRGMMPIASPRREMLVYIGMHGSQIRAAHFDPVTGSLTAIGPVADQSAPTWAVRHPSLDILYYVREDGNDGSQSGAVCAYRIDRASGGLRLLNETIAQGGGTTHLHLDAPSMTIIASNFGGGTVSAIPIMADGRLGAVSSVLVEQGSGPHRRQSSPHPHGAAMDPTGQYALVADLGADRIFVHRFDRATRALLYDRPDQQLDFVAWPGSGPRHIAFHPNGRLMFALTELSGELMTFRWEPERGALRQIDTRTASSSGFTGERSLSELAISADGKLLYLTDRGENTIVVHAIDPSSGALTFLQRISCGGEFPWHFAIDQTGSWILVANERSNRIETFRINATTGRVVPTGTGLDTPKPVHILFAGVLA
jgi:6-phosphogluconolactonase (cycloisomerase 2 family)